MKINILQKKCNILIKDIYSNLTPWQITQIARHPDRPYTMDYINTVFKDFHELHGDRAYADDNAIISSKCTISRYFGCRKWDIRKEGELMTRLKEILVWLKPHEGGRKALRVMKLAERFNMPIITFIDTPGRISWN